MKEFSPVFEAQLLNYMELMQCPKGILINFNCSNIFKEGQKTIVNDFFILYQLNKKLIPMWLN
ncbi:hypothetical protein OZ662_02495 [Elizabethkingia sp. HX WYD]|nr:MULTISPECIES: GxxExxY protein [Elizabethkingia]MDX8574269.1 hypothetical protein [Elizabethkingia sp. HX WYD]